MNNRTLIILGIVIYIFSVFTSAENLSGESIVHPFFVLLSEVARIVFIIWATVRLWKKSKVASILLPTASVIHIGLTIMFVALSPDYGSPIIIAMNIAKVINFLCFIWAIYLLWKTVYVKYESSLINIQTSIIGKDIRWNQIVGQVFRVIEFDRNETIITNEKKVKAKTYFTPYGYLLVESPIFNQQVILPITHKTDFYLACTAYDNLELKPLLRFNDLLVTYVPKRKYLLGFTGVRRAIHYVITSQLTLSKYYHYDYDYHMSYPKPEKLFGKFTFEGMVKVEVILHPKIDNG
jgi:hypothetical protein